MPSELTRLDVGPCTVFIPTDPTRRRAWSRDASFADRVSMPVVIPGGLADSFSLDVDPFDDNVTIFVGPKGMGKSTLLLLKRVLLEGAAASDGARPFPDIVCLPDGANSAAKAFRAPRGKGDELSFAEARQWGQFSEEAMWEAVWLFLLSLFVLQCESDRRAAGRHIGSGRSKHDDARDTAAGSGPAGGDVGAEVAVPPEAKALVGLSAGDRVESADFWRYLSRLVQNCTPRAVLSGLYDNVLLGRLRLAARANRFCIFLDAIDEKLRDERGQQLLRYVHSSARIPDGTETEDGGRITRNYDIWSNAQVSLIGVCDKLMHDTNRRVKLYTSMRSEAYHSYAGGQAVGQLADVCKVISYDRSRLEIIAKINILADLERKDAKSDAITQANIPSRLDSAVGRFFGTSFYRTASEEEEEWVSCIIRHTMERPRELVTIGEAIRTDRCPSLASMSVEQKLQEIQRSANDIIKDFVKFLGIAWDERIEKFVYPLICSNTLTRQDLADISAEVKKATAGQLDHPFCRLYSLGLVGAVWRADSGREIQKFDFTAIDTKGSLDQGLPPGASKFLLHPLLHCQVAQMPSSRRRKEYQPRAYPLIGNQREWPDHLPRPRVRISVEEDGLRITVNGIAVFGRGLMLEVETRLATEGKDRKVVMRARRFERPTSQPSLLLVLVLLTLYKNCAMQAGLVELRKTLKELLQENLVPPMLPRDGNIGRGGGEPSTGRHVPDSTGDVEVDDDSSAVSGPIRARRHTIEALEDIWPTISNDGYILSEINVHIRRVTGVELRLRFVDRVVNGALVSFVCSENFGGSDILVENLPASLLRT